MPDFRFLYFFLHVNAEQQAFRDNGDEHLTQGHAWQVTDIMLFIHRLYF